MLDGTRVCVGRPQKGRMVVNKKKSCERGKRNYAVVEKCNKVDEISVVVLSSCSFSLNIIHL